MDVLDPSRKASRQKDSPAGVPAPLEDLLPEGQDDPVAAVRAGLPYAAFERIRRAVGAPDPLLARVLSVSERTLLRRKEHGRLTSEESDRLLLLAEVFRLAVLAFDDEDGARAWLSEPHALLGGESPLEHMDTIAGIEEVKTMLYHIEYSMPV